ncbi:MAG TPA: DUF2971 domain-containing protein [Methylotenera sp.]|nr:DUF2971 domain-containing protein [Methylotenera sp.]HPV43915.1 DUF2971 domain-containing protein [Methylotenera sp.]
MEGKLADEALERLAKQDRLNAYDISTIKEELGIFRLIADGLGFCLSEEEDLLSQWRGYAADASGVAIGFSKEYLTEFIKHTQSSISINQIALHKVKYEQKEHDKLVEPTFRRIKQCIEEGAHKYPGPRGLLDIRSEEEIKEDNQKIQHARFRLAHELFKLSPKQFYLKSKAFSEEREWRLISYLTLGNDKDKCEFMDKKNQIVPFRTYQLNDLSINPISKIILGPKNVTPIKVVESFLMSNNFRSVEVVSSKATYR